MRPGRSRRATPRRTLARPPKAKLERTEFHDEQAARRVEESTVPTPLSAAGDALERVSVHEGPRQQAPARASHSARVIRRKPIYDAAGQPQSIEFMVGTELTAQFAQLAQQAVRDGALSDADIRTLRDHALQARATFSDQERMFVAGLLDPANVATLRTAKLGAGSAITFSFASVTQANYRHVIALDRAAAPPVADDAAASSAIVAHADPFKSQAANLVAFALANKVALADVLAAMLAAASDKAAADRVFAGVVYAITASANHPLKDDIRNGRIKVDALSPAAYAQVGGLQGTKAAYITVGQGTGTKGDTMYVKTDLDPFDVIDRSFVIHELTHATVDKAAPKAGAITKSPKAQLEVQSYRAQGRYLLDQMQAQKPAERTATATRLGNTNHVLILFGILREAHGQGPLHKSALDVIFGAANPPLKWTPAQVATALAAPVAKIDALLLTAVEGFYNLKQGDWGPVEGFSGESLIHWIARPI